MNEIVLNGPWILAQMVRIRTLETEVKKLLATRKPAGSVLRRRMAELDCQPTLLDLEIN